MNFLFNIKEAQLGKEALPSHVNAFDNVVRAKGLIFLVWVKFAHILLLSLQYNKS